VEAHPYPMAIVEQEFNKRFDVKQEFTRKNCRNNAWNGTKIAGSSTHLYRDATMGIDLGRAERVREREE
jgi:hypothetical protein